MATEMPPNVPSKSSGSKVGIIVIVLVLVVIGLPVCGCVGCFATIYFGVSSMIKGSEPYQVAIERAQENQEVIDKLGEPINPASIPQGSINLQNDAGDCDLRIPVSGPNGDATIIVRGTRSGGIWEYDEMSVTIDGETIDLDP